jgi:hypothetical protein
LTKPNVKMLLAFVNAQANGAARRGAVGGREIANCRELRAYCRIQEKSWPGHLVLQYLVPSAMQIACASVCTPQRRQLILSPRAVGLDASGASQLASSCDDSRSSCDGGSIERAPSPSGGGAASVAAGTDERPRPRPARERPCAPQDREVIDGKDGTEAVEAASARAISMADSCSRTSASALLSARRLASTSRCAAPLPSPPWGCEAASRAAETRAAASARCLESFSL